MYIERRYKKRLYRNRPFILLGNEIDGRLFSEQFYFFDSLSELKNQLPTILKKINGEGEWAFDLYQVPSTFKIWHRWGYYKYPDRGTKLFRYSYINLPIKAVQFHDHEMSFFGAMKWDKDYIKYVGSDVEVEISRLIWNWK